MVEVLFFAELRERLGVASQSVEWSHSCSRVSGLRQQLLSENPAWVDVLNADNILVAVNQKMVRTDCEVNDGDEVAFFPPVTGG